MLLAMHQIARRAASKLLSFVAHPHSSARFFEERVPSGIAEYARCLARAFNDNWLVGIPAQSGEPYATHLPILKMLAEHYPLRHVLELGSGLHSTGAFLDRRLFPDLAHLDSAETDQEWAGKVTK
jgi:hypothetical protein